MQDDLIVTGLTVHAGARPILTSLDHTFPAGTVTLIIGRSGTGKTLLLETLSGLREPAAGHIQVADEPLWHARNKLNRRALLLLGTAFQHPEHQLFARSVRDEYLYTLSPYGLPVEERVTRMELMHAESQSDTESSLERDPFTLSGGEKRRLTLSLLQAAEPDWLLLDEPTAGVDQEGMSGLCRHLKAWKLSGKGAIVVTHDAENLLPIADHVLILHAGGVVWDGTPDELSEHPHVLEDAGLALSERLATLRMLRKAGFEMPAGWVDARAAAEAIARGLSRGAAEAVEGAAIEEAVMAEEAIGRAETAEIAVGAGRVSAGEPGIAGGRRESAAISQQEVISTAGTPIGARSKRRFIDKDPLAVWLSYMLISTGILLQTHWVGWLAGAAVTLIVALYSGVPFRQWSKPVVGFLLFMIIASVLSGLTIDSPETQAVHSRSAALWSYVSGLGFAVGPAVETFFRFGRLMMVMLSGLVLLSGISHIRLKRALEQRLSGLRYLRFPVNQFALVGSLMVRFLPTVVDEWHRFARISAARGKYPVRPGRLPLRRISQTAVPFLLSLLRIGEMWSMVLMSRGVGREGWSPTRDGRMKLSRQDGYLIASAVGVLLILLLINFLYE